MTNEHGIYLATPYLTKDIFNEFIKTLDKTLKSSDIECVMIRFENNVANQEKSIFTEELNKIIHENELVSVILDELEIALNKKCDGIHFSILPDKFKNLIKSLPDNFYVGVSCNESRHDAMMAGECGANYIAFDNTELISWWAELFNIPSVATGINKKEDINKFIDAGADLILIEKDLV